MPTSDVHGAEADPLPLRWESAPVLCLWANGHRRRPLGMRGLFLRYLPEKVLETRIPRASPHFRRGCCCEPPREDFEPGKLDGPCGFFRLRHPLPAFPPLPAARAEVADGAKDVFFISYHHSMYDSNPFELLDCQSIN